MYPPKEITLAPHPYITTLAQNAPHAAAATAAAPASPPTPTPSINPTASSSSRSTTILIALAGPLGINVEGVNLRDAALQPAHGDAGPDASAPTNLPAAPAACSAPSASAIWGAARDDVHMVSVAFSTDGQYLAAAAMNGSFAIGRYDQASDSYIPCREAGFEGAQLCYIPARPNPKPVENTP